MNPGRVTGEDQQPVRPPEAGANPRQVVTLAFLSEQLPALLISQQLACSLHAETGASVVLVRFQPEEGFTTNEPARPEMYLNGEFHLPPSVPRTEGGYYSLTLNIRGEPPSPAGIHSMVSKLSRHFRHILVAVPVSEPPTPWTLELLQRSDIAYLFVKATTDDVYHLEVVTRGVRKGSRNGGRQLKPIGCLADGEQIHRFDSLAQLVGNPIHMFVHGCPPASDVEPGEPQASANTFRTDIRRLAREVGGRLTGLALSSGAAKGFAHVGVIQVLEENGIEVDVVAGASMGAYVGCLWAHGNDGAELERLSREMESRWAFWTLIDPVFPPRQGFLRGYSVKKRLMRSIGKVRFGDLVRPLRVVAANLSTLERAVFSSGEVADAVHASIAVPGICVPITLDDGETYIDGGIVDPLPVDVLREMGVSRIIAVDVIPTPDRIRCGLEAERELARHNGKQGRKLWSKFLPIDQQLNYFARGNLFEILMRSLHGAQIRVAEASCRMADLVLHPDICDDRWLDYRNPGKFIALGREVAERHLGEIKALVNRTEVTHERNRASESMATVV